VPIVIDLAELYIALSQGTVNGYELPFLAVVTTKLVEVTKNVAVTNHVYNGGAFMASKVRFDTLTPKEQEVIRGTVKEIQPAWRKLVAEKSIENRKICEQRGLKVNEIDYPAFRKAMEPVYAEFRGKIGSEFADKVIKAASA
jgi:TRAP-type transport system periplasmic protein